MVRKKLPLFMQDTDLSEIYTYLELFGKVYDGYDKEIEKIRQGILKIYSEEYHCHDADDALRRLGNPRNAGRKAKYAENQKEQIRALSAAGMSIREIATETGMPKSSVQRWLRR